MDDAPVCATCGHATDDDHAAVVRGEWRICQKCHTKWRGERIKVPWDVVQQKLSDGLILQCGECFRRLGGWTRRPVVVMLGKTAEIEWVRCGACVALHREQKALDAIIRRLENGESAPTLLAEGIEERLVVSAVTIVRQQRPLFR